MLPREIIYEILDHADDQSKLRVFSSCGAYYYDEEFNQVINRSVNWDDMSTGDCSTYFIERYSHVLNWKTLGMMQPLNKYIVVKYHNYLHWDYLYTILSEDVIRLFDGVVNWEYISYNQPMSEELVVDYENSIVWAMVRLDIQPWSWEFKEKILLKYGGVVTSNH